MKQRATETGDITTHSPAIDVGGLPMLIFDLIVYRIQGGTPDATVTLQYSNDLEIWTSTADTASLGAPGSDITAVRAHTSPYGRYVRFLIVVSGTVTELEYSLVLNTYQDA